MLEYFGVKAFYPAKALQVAMKNLAKNIE